MSIAQLSPNSPQTHFFILPSLSTTPSTLPQISKLHDSTGTTTTRHYSLPSLPLPTNLMTYYTKQPTEPVKAPDDHRLKRRSRPGSGWLAGLTADDVKRLNFDNFTFDNAVAPEYPTPAAISFVSDAHRTVSLLSGIVEEVEMLRKHTDELFETTLPAVVVDNPATIWKETDRDETIYGIKADIHRHRG
ncbi:hypothetical protein EDB80DRAFT_882893 [Ilyonectria destructans]|nr:hypothetical protein EDB80DRAFT_875487 [Ilyonectria destructans]KAH6971348.1 hypothetical protein EDB80DRAFT_875014 [Ilyonectria destructans]KAH6996735.1 hypothetical protein EDB80DRAFT_882893 [Ilyonectria destructans]